MKTKAEKWKEKLEDANSKIREANNQKEDTDKARPKWRGTTTNRYEATAQVANSGAIEVHISGPLKPIQVFSLMRFFLDVLVPEEEESSDANK